MRKILSYFTTILILASCNNDKQSVFDEITPLFPVPQTVALNIKEGYKINPVTGKIIQPIINSFGDTIITGVPVPAKGKVIHPGSVAKPKIIRAGKPKVVRSHQNVHKIPETLTVIPVNKDLLKTFTPGEDFSSFVLVNSTGDTIPTGVPIPAKEKIVPCIQPQPVEALLPQIKENAIINMKYLNLEQGMNSADVRSILEDSRGNLWFGTWIGGVSKYNGKSFTHFTEKEGLSNNTVTSILEDSHGNLWFGTEGGGVSKYNGESFTHFTEKDGLNSNEIWFMLEDSYGNLWIGTRGGGVSKYNGETFTHFTEKEGLSNNTVRSILEDRHGNLWFGTDGGGVNKYNGESFTHFTEKEGLSNNEVQSIFEDSAGNLWFGTRSSGVSMYNGETFTHFTEKEGLSHNNVASILEDDQGNLWFGTRGGGVSVYNGETFTHFTEKEGLSDNRVRSIVEDRNSNIWISTEKGLNRLMSAPANDSRIMNSLSATGVKRDSVKAAFLNPVIHSYGLQDGLKAMNFLQDNSAFLDSKNRIWWGTGKSLAMLDMNNLKTSTLAPSNMQLNQIDVNEQFVDYRNINDNAVVDMEFNGVAKFYNYPLNLKLPFNSNHLTFHFSAIDWLAPHKIKYSYRMEGLNDNWSLPTSEAKADYRSLPYGTFTFKVRAIGAAQKWSETFEYTFTILPPWWHTWWARISYAGILILLVFFTIRKRTENLKLRQVELETEVENSTANLKSANKELEAFSYSVSHDLRAPLRAINGFTNILIEDYASKLDEEGKRLGTTINDNAKKMGKLIDDLLAFSRVGRASMTLTKIDMKGMANDIYQEATTAEERKRIKFSVADLPQAEGDTNLMRQVWMNLIKNAVKYSSKRKQAIISVTYNKEENKVIYCIKDNGAGFNMKYVDKLFGVFKRLHGEKDFKGTGIGLSLVQRIIKRHDGKVWAEGEVDKGASFYFSLPNKIK